MPSNQPGPTNKQAGSFKTLWAHSHHWTWTCPPQGPESGPMHHCTNTRPEIPTTLQSETLGPSSTHQWARTTPRIPGSTHQWACSSLRNSLAYQQADTSNRTTIAPQSMDPAHLPTSQYQPWESALPTSRPPQDLEQPRCCNCLFQEPTPCTSGPTPALRFPGPCSQNPGPNSACQVSQH